MKFSIITPSFNQLDWLRLCMTSVRDQLGENETMEVEHIIQDAGTPRIEEFARETGADFHRDGKLMFSVSASQIGSFPRHRIAVYSEADGGMYDAINRGLLRSTGEICAWLNCDEQYLAGSLAKVSRWFAVNSTRDVLSGGIVVTNAAGDYLCSRIALVPQKWHTLVSGTLSFPSAATWFRRSIVDRKLLLDPRWKMVGDAAWAAGLIDAGVRFGVCSDFLATYAFLSSNLSEHGDAQKERDELAAQAPSIARQLRPAIIAGYRLRKLLAGGYWIPPHTYSIYTKNDSSQRQHFSVDQPTSRWPGS